VLRLQARALEHERFGAAATAVVTEMAQLLRCDRVSVGFHHQGRVRVAALSHGGDIQQQQNLVRNLAAAMHEALDQHNFVIHPLPRNSAPGLTLAHAELARHNGRLPICTVPIASRGRLFGAFLLERREGIDLHTLEAAKDAASFIGPLLELKHRLNQPVGGRLADAVAPPGRRIGPLVVRTPALAFGTLALAAVVAAFWPTTLRVLAPARVEGAGQRVIAAPVDGFVQSVVVRPGELVKAGQLLLTLEDRDLALERDKWAAEASQLDKLYREALTQDEAAQIVIARSKFEQAQAQLQLLQRQIARARITAPMDGVVLTGDLSQAVGSPVKRGQELMTLAPDQRFRIVAEVDEQDVAQLQPGQQARVMFGALVGRSVALQVQHIAPVATALEHGNVFEVDALPLQDTLPDTQAGSPATAAPGLGSGLRPGLRGVMRIDIEPSTLGAVWWQRASHWLQRTSWRWLG
jgi:multidrug efflux pump subunit AcrA (membrane-fusion protein)